MPRTPLVRLLQRPGPLGALLFVATVVAVAALALQAARAAAMHRAAAHATLTDHSTSAAWRLAGAGRNWIRFGMVEAANRLRSAANGAVLPGPELLSTALAEKECDCMSAGFSRTVFRVTFGSEPKLFAVGEPLSERAKDGLIAAAAALTADTSRPAGGSAERWTILPPGTPRLTRATDVPLLWVISAVGRDRRARAVYGMIVEPEQIARPLKGALGEAEFFPPSLVPAHLADSLVRIEVAGPNGHPIFTAGRETRVFVGRDTLGKVLGELTVTAAIHPDAAPLLLPGGLPHSRVAAIVALLLLALSMSGAALLLLRREHRLARLREDFVSSVSHELRTPLTQIRLLSELLQSEGFRTEEERGRATNVIHRESLRLTNLVDNVLEFSRLRRTNGAGPQPRTPVSLANVATELAESFAPLLEAQGSRLELAIAEDVAVTTDRDGVNRVLRNLVENAAKYGPAGQTIRLTLTGGDLPGSARITVDDEGPGIPRDERPRIWQPYYRLDRNRNAPMGGSGLGLSVVADLMRELGGRASVEDAPGKGARFTVELPGIPTAGVK